MKVQAGEKLRTGTLSLSILLASLGTSMANIALPAISGDFNASYSSVRWIVLAYLLSSTFFSLVAGYLGDRRGQRAILLAGTILYTIGTFTAGVASSLDCLVFARSIQGLGGAALIALPMAIATDLTRKDYTGRVIGFLATMSAIGTASGPTLGGFILGSYDWRAVFFVMAFLGCLSFLLLLIVIPPVFSPGKDQKDQTLYAAIHLIYSNELLRPQFFYNFVVSLVMMTTLITGPFYLTQGLHLESHQMGLVMAVGPFTSAIFGYLSGYFVDRFGAVVVVKVGLILLLVGSFSFILMPLLVGELGFGLCAALLSMGYQLFLSANSSRVLRVIQPHQRGFASGSLGLTRNLGLIGGAYFMGGIFDHVTKVFMRSDGSSEAISKGLQITFLIATTLIAFLLVSHLKEQNRRKYETEFAN